MAARKRHPRHDDLVANIVGQPTVLLSYVESVLGPCETERPIIEWEVEEKWAAHGKIRTKRIGWADVAVPGMNESGRFVMLIEVKSELEKWTAGDVVRQLKRYATAVTTRAYDRMNVAMAFYCDRALTDAESALFKHEGVHVLK